MRGTRVRLAAALVVLPLVGAVMVALAGPAAAVGPGSLDTAWNTTGVVTTSVLGVDIANAVVVAPSGATIAAGQAQTVGEAPHFAVVRYTPNGSLDSSFGSGGQAVTPYFFSSTNGDQANAVAVQTNGKIVVAGSASDAFGVGALAVARYNSNGTLDSSFGSGGQAMVTVGDGSANTGQGMTIEPNGKIVVVGSWAGGWAVARFTSAGFLDKMFNAAGARPGVQAFDLGDSIFDNAYAVTTMTVAGRTVIVVGGSAAHNRRLGPGRGNEDFGLVRFKENGSFDHAFGQAGVVRTNLGGNSDQISALTVQSDGMIDAVGQSGNATSPHGLAIARYNADGSLDTSFNGTGTTVVTSTAPTDARRGIGVLADGSILAAATSTTNSGDIRVVKLTPSGALDSGFGNGGMVVTDVAQDEGNALAIDSTNGRVVVAGAARTDASNASFLLTRYLASAPVIPVVSAISPDAGPAAGGTHVTVSGSGFTGASAVMFGATPATSFTVNSDRKITATAPGRPPANVHVQVSGPGGTSPPTAADVFKLPQPAVTSISPASGSSAGGTSVTVAGSGFTGATNVLFGSTPAAGYTVNSDSSITAVSPPLPVSKVHVRVASPGGTSFASPSDLFTVTAP